MTVSWSSGKMGARILVRFAGCLALSLVMPHAWAQYPNKPVKLMVGFAPAGATDIAGRIIAPRLSQFLGQQVVLDNRPGAGGNIASEILAKSAPDGYTIMLNSVGPLAVSPHFELRLGFDPLKDFAPLSLAVSFSNVLVVHPAVNASTVAEYVKLAQDKSANLVYGTSGIGSLGHLAGELFKQMARVEIAHVPFKGGGPAMNDLLGGNIPSLFATTPSVLPQVQAGKIKALATTGLQRSSSLPNVPTFAESGYPGYEAMNWYAFVAPAKTPPDILNRLNSEIVRALNDPEIRDKLRENGMDATPSTREEMAAYMRSEYAKWGRVVKAAGIKPE
jgi:tripartite-type tricarboxylate transporter receptor subunit TctC